MGLCGLRRIQHFAYEPFCKKEENKRKCCNAIDVAALAGGGESRAGRRFCIASVAVLQKLVAFRMVVLCYWLRQSGGIAAGRGKYALSLRLFGRACAQRTSCR
jgi:hypothetical protein